MKYYDETNREKYYKKEYYKISKLLNDSTVSILLAKNGFK